MRLKILYVILVILLLIVSGVLGWRCWTFQQKDTRLDLENRVRAFNSPAILERWSKFTNSQTEAEAQTEAKKLLLMLIQ